MDFFSRRLFPYALRLVGRHPSDYAQELQNFLEELWGQVLGGIPGGFRRSTPTTVTVGGTAVPGTELAGWMAADAQLVVASGTPVGLANANTPGSSTEAIASDAGIKRDVRIFVNGVELATRNALNIVGLAVVDEGAVKDRIQISGGSVPGSLRERTSDFSLYQSTVGSYALRKVMFERFGRRV